MRKLILKMSITLDGFVCGPKGELDWIFKSFDPQLTAWTVSTLWQAGLHLMGSRTYYDMASWWPWSIEPIARPMNEIPKAVYTSSGKLHASPAGHTSRAVEDALRARTASGSAPALPSAAIVRSWSHPAILSGEFSGAMAQLKRDLGKDIVAHGGARFAQSLIATGLIDEYQLIVHPIALRRGQPLFSGLPQPLPLELIRSTAFPAGAVAHVYRPLRPSLKPFLPESSRARHAGRYAQPHAIPVASVSR
jgi:dihydrofolate reductase